MDLKRKTTNRIYSIWAHMKTRCYNSNAIGYKYWGGKGITVCKEWAGFLSFYNWAKDKYREGLQIDRINNNGNYTPENCRFTTRKENIRNSSATKLNIQKVKKIKKLLKERKLLQREIAKIFNVAQCSISRIKIEKGWAEVI